MSFGWAYVDCGATGGSAIGPSGSIQFMTASGTGSTLGTNSLKYLDHQKHLILTGTLIVEGTVSASIFRYQDISTIDATGSTFFGDSDQDTHRRIGSLVVRKAGGAATPILSASTTTEAVHVRGFNVLYEPISNGGDSVNIRMYTASAPSYILGVQHTKSVEIQIPNAATYKAGALLLVKDETEAHIDGTDITLRIQNGASYRIDGGTSYILTGSRPAISLYSNGTNWFVF
tara:strand:+ start:212 stop:904 length:693 start_codon:yes stop_codon:yes gene_type:complete